MQLDERSSVATAVPNGTEAARDQIDRILASNTFHASDVLRRLLRFLADKTFAGTADDLKEYSVGLDALGKPATYDPRQDAAVRLHASRLRQKLDDYYRNEGKSDSLIVELPKGRFKIAWHPRGIETLPVAAVPLPPVAVPRPIETPAPPAIVPHTLKIWRNVAIGATAMALVFAFVTVWSLARASKTLTTTHAANGSTPELDALWRPFLSPAHHLIIAFVNPLFVRLQRKGGVDVVFRTSGNNTWEDVLASPELPALKRAMGDAEATPTFNLVERSNLISTFALSQFFARRREDVSLARADEVSWQQLSDNDVIVFGPFMIDGGPSALPVKPPLVLEKTGIRNLQPAAGEPSVYPDSADHSPGNGEALELVSMMPGPLGRTTVATFSSHNKWGVIGGVQSLTDPAFAKVIVEKLRAPSGKMPSYFQLVLRMKYRDGTLTHVSYVTHRALTMSQSSVETGSAK
jgi:hypothetical protein